MFVKQITGVGDGIFMEEFVNSMFFLYKVPGAASPWAAMVLTMYDKYEFLLLTTKDLDRRVMMNYILLNFVSKISS